MGSRQYGVIKRAKKPKYAPLVGGDFNKKFAEFAKRKGMNHGPIRAPRLGSKTKKAETS